MFGSAVLDVAIGMILLFAFISLVCSALREAIETFMKSRAMDLERAIREMLRDDDGNGLAKKFYESPFISALFAGDYKTEKLKTMSTLPGSGNRKIMPLAGRANLPSYIPSEAFAAAIVDLIHAKSGAVAPLSASSLRVGAEAIQNPALRRTVLEALDKADNDLNLFRNAVENWYDTAMDRVSSWYKRRTQMVLLAIGLGTAIVFNLDALTIARHLTIDKTYRDFIVAKAGEFRNDDRFSLKGTQTDRDAGGSASARPQPTSRDGDDKDKSNAESQSAQTTASTQHPGDQAKPQARNQNADTAAKAQLSIVRQELVETGFAMGWPAPQFDNGNAARSGTLLIILQMLAGWCVTALAVSFGAPFWFDVLDKFVSIRSVVKPLGAK